MQIQGLQVQLSITSRAAIKVTLEIKPIAVQYMAKYMVTASKAR